jgi:hypothetical protein
VGVIEDGMAGRLDGPPDEAVTAEEVRRHRGVPHRDLLRRWDELAPLMEVAISDGEIWPAAFDVLSHEHDVRGALGQPGARDIDSVAIAATHLVDRLQVPLVLRVQTEGGVLGTSPVDAPELVLGTTAFEVLRFRLGRRSRQQVLDLDWSAPPPPEVVDALFVFGPRSDPLVE